MVAQAVVLAFLALYVPLTGWRLQRRLGLYLVGLYVLSQVPPLHASPRVISVHASPRATSLLASPHDKVLLLAWLCVKPLLAYPQRYLTLQSNVQHQASTAMSSHNAMALDSHVQRSTRSSALGTC